MSEIEQPNPRDRNGVAIGSTATHIIVCTQDEDAILSAELTVEQARHVVKQLLLTIDQLEVRK